MFEEFEASLEKMLVNNHKIIALLEDGLLQKPVEDAVVPETLQVEAGDVSCRSSPGGGKG